MRILISKWHLKFAQKLFFPVRERINKNELVKRTPFTTIKSPETNIRIQITFM